MDSWNHGGPPVSVRQLPPCYQADLSHRSEFMADVFVVNSGFRTRQPLVAAATNSPEGRAEGRPSKEGNTEAIGVTLRQLSIGLAFRKDFSMPKRARYSANILKQRNSFHHLGSIIH
jgi:hypothetical protein